VLLPLRVEFENVESILHIDFTLQLDSMCDLILLFHQVQLLLDSWVILEFVLAHLEQHFDHVLCSLVDIGFVQNVSKLVKYSHGNRRLHLLQILPNLSTETNRNLNTIVGRLMKQEKQNLTSEHFMLNLLVDKMCQEGSRGKANSLVVSLESLSELHNQTTNQELADLG
jgi:hypothetical protein